MKKLLALVIVLGILLSAVSMCASAEETVYATLGSGSYGSAVKNLQQRLAELKYLKSSDIDGSYGKGTERAVRQFQGAAGLPETGIADSLTQSTLYAEDAPESPDVARTGAVATNGPSSGAANPAASYSGNGNILVDNDRFTALVDGHYLVLTIKGLDLKDEYIYNKEGASENTAAYIWGVNFTDFSYRYQVFTACWNFNPGHPQVASLRGMQSSISSDYFDSYAPNAAMEHTSNSITWRVDLNVVKDLNVRRISKFEVDFPNPENEEHTKREEYPVENAEKLSQESGFEYVILSEGTAKIVTYVGDQKTVSVPERVNGVPVTAIGDNAFSGSSLIGIMIPDGVKTIGRNVFQDCVDLENVSIPDSVSEISYYAFSGCESLKHLKLPEGIETIESSVFRNSGLTEITIPANIVRIRSSAFYGCENLAEVEILDGATNIEKSAFRNCGNLVSVKIPETVKAIGDGAFDGCSPDLVVTVKSASYAEEYCTQNNIEYRHAVPGHAPAKYLMGDAAVGDYVVFGTYEQDNDLTDGREPIEWLVLDVQDGKALLISRYGLDYQPYHTTRTFKPNWETSTLRSWLNSDFINTAFTDIQQEQIVSTTVKADAFPNSGVNPGNDTKDKIFLIGYDEASNHFRSDGNRVCITTEYCLDKIILKLKETLTEDTDRYIRNAQSRVANWWLRTLNTQSTPDYAGIVCVNDAGDIIESYITGCDQYRVVRPALWVNLES